MGGVVLEPDQHGGRSCARRQLFGWCLMGVRCDPRGRGDFSISNFHPGPIPGNLGETIFGVRKIARAEGGGLFWATSLEKIFGGVISLISFRLTWDRCSSLLPF